MILWIESDGWTLARQKGSHKQFRHPEKKGVVTISDHGKGKMLDHFVVDSILKQAELKKTEK
jgi:predicted RNA binding protein YcfA (HicA-like mRNA interferase family)